MIFFQQPKFPFSIPKTLKPHFFQLVNSRFSNARDPILPKRANIVSTELFVPLQWTWNMKDFLLFTTFFSSQNSRFLSLRP